MAAQMSASTKAFSLQVFARRPVMSTCTGWHIKSGPFHFVA